MSMLSYPAIFKSSSDQQILNLTRLPPRCCWILAGN